MALTHKMCYQNSRLPNGFLHYYNGIGRKEKIEDSFTVKIKCSWLLPKQLFLECLIIKPYAVSKKSSISFSSYWQEAHWKLNSATEGENTLLLKTLQNSVLFERKSCHLVGKSCIACMVNKTGWIERPQFPRGASSSASKAVPGTENMSKRHRAHCFSDSVSCVIG